VAIDRKKRIALYGGTFDPIHRGHLEIARKISRLFEIDELWFVLARVAPHKQSRLTTPAFDRYAMLALATEAEPGLLLSIFELSAPGHTYTVDTLAHFKQLWGDAADIFFIMGADSWSEITTWREWRRVLTTTNHIVVSRPGYALGVAHIDVDIADGIVDVRGMESDEVNTLLGTRTSESIFITDAVMTDVSATAIRAAANDDSRELKDLVPAAVATYIRKYKLYRETNERKFNH
jgi:nicotinate-nucleotide adenylyltransferase